MGNELIKFIKEYSDSILVHMQTLNVLSVILCSLSIILILAFLLFRILSKCKEYKKYASINTELLDSANPAEGIEKNLDSILNVFCGIIDAKGYAFYVLDNNKNSFSLKAIRYLDDEDGYIGPSYSGLTPYEKESYLHPTSIPIEKIPEKVGVYNDGSVPLLSIPVRGGKGLIKCGPVTSVPSRVISIMRKLSENLEPVLNSIIEVEKLRVQVGTIVASNKAFNNVSQLVMDDTGMIGTIISLSSKTIYAEGGFFVRMEGRESTVMAAIGFDDGTLELFKHDTEGHAAMEKIVGYEEVVMMNKGNKQYYKVPPYFAAADIKSLILIRVKSSNIEGIAGFWYCSQIEEDHIDEHRVKVLRMMTSKIADILQNREKLKKLSASHINTLRILVDIMDNQNNYTVGYSDLMARYSAIIAKEMGLEESDIKDVALAAYFSNIGLLGVSRGLTDKKGRFSEVEYEMMKLHSDTGALIIESTIGNYKVGAFIRHHHERMDGNGYPSGLKGTEIPLGARIIFVVQTFLAKINGREEREALSFSKAIELLESASGSQLDTEVVNAFIAWYNRKRLNPLVKGRSLGHCWEMRCSPENICEGCPAYGDMEKNCWEHKRVNCEQHGNECKTCFIYTEYLDRISKHPQ